MPRHHLRAIEADQSSFQMYPSGRRSGNCGTSLDHVVLTAVLGTLSGTDYWKARTHGDPAGMLQTNSGCRGRLRDYVFSSYGFGTLGGTDSLKRGRIVISAQCLECQK